MLMHKPPGTRSLGFTLLELMVVLLIIALMSSIAAPQVMKYLGRAKGSTARIQVEALANAVESFQLDMGRVPTNEEGLKVLLDPPSDGLRWDGPYIKKAESIVDPWNAPYLYRTPGKKGDFDIYTLGSDGKEGGDHEAADIGTWDDRH